MTAGSRHPVPWRRIRPTRIAAAAVASLGLLGAGCSIGQHAAVPAPRPAPHNTPAASVHPARTATPPAPAGPSATAPAPGASATTAPRPVFQASASALTAAMRTRMTGVSWQAGCPVSLGRLRLLRLSYWGFDHAVHRGELVVNKTAAADLTRAFGLLFAAR